jgi:hypothetical protein
MQFSKLVGAIAFLAGASVVRHLPPLPILLQKVITDDGEGIGLWLCLAYAWQGLSPPGQ